MTELSIQQRQLITDYHLGLLDESEVAEVQRLLAESSQAQDFLQRLQAVLAPLKSLREPKAPDSLVAMTLARVNSAASLQTASPLKMAPEQFDSAPARPRLLRMPELITIAASIALALGFLFPVIRQWRQLALRQSCAFQQASIGTGLRSYAADHDGNLPRLPANEGKTWMRAARLGRKRTDTSNLFILVKAGYAKPQVFICPAVKHSSDSVRYVIHKRTDFPTESAVSYSYQNMFGPHRPTLSSPPGFAILADRNPLLALGKRPTEATVFLHLTSPNHGSDRGQNVLRLSGSVDWSETDDAGFKGDNIWKPADFSSDRTASLQGQEVPANAEDSFLGP